MVNDGAEPDTLICSFHKAVSLPWQHVCSKDMVKAVQQLVEALGPFRQWLQPKMDWYPPSLGRWSHSPLHNKKDALTIQCAGRWTSTTFMDYIHGQLDVTTHGLVQAMSMQTPYHNMAQ